MQDPEINLHGWVTIAELAKRIGKPTSYISTNISRGRIPVKEIKELNNLKLVPGDWTIPV